jgi:hypothetical protein
MANINYILNVPTIAQKGSMLCWAAAIEMVLEYFKVNITQGDLFNSMKELYNEALTPAQKIECNNANYCDIEEFVTQTNGKPWNEVTPDEFNVPYFDCVFSKQDYYSVEDASAVNGSSLTWEVVVNQITICRRPFILVLKEVDDNGDSIYPSTHAVVVIGIWEGEDEINKKKYLYVNDPLDPDSPCNGTSYLLDFDSLINNTSALRIKSAVINIMQKDDLKLKYTKRGRRDYTVSNLNLPNAQIVNRLDGLAAIASII